MEIDTNVAGAIDKKDITQEIKELVKEFKLGVSSKDEIIATQTQRINELEFSLYEVKDMLMDIVTGKGDEDVSKENTTTVNFN